jgi:hypothetical protein
VKFIRLHIIGEGQTEQRFVKEVLAEHLGAYNIVALTSINGSKTWNLYQCKLPAYWEIFPFTSF